MSVTPVSADFQAYGRVVGQFEACAGHASVTPHYIPRRCTTRARADLRRVNALSVAARFLPEGTVDPSQPHRGENSMTRLLAAAFLLLSTWMAHAAPIVFHTSLSGAAEAPANPSLGTGFATVTMDDAADTLRVEVTFSGLTGTTTASHVHCCTAVPGAGTAGVATELPLFTGFPTGVTSGTYDHTFDTSLLATWNPAFVTANGGNAESAADAFLAGMLAGKAYLNIHTNVFPAGEIRGFLGIPEPGTLALLGLALGAFALRRRAVH
jgi:CHRD domain/PEP-CTERM motif